MRSDEGEGVDKAKCEADRVCQMSNSPSEPFEVKDGREEAAIEGNSGFGTVFGVVDGKPLPVCDYAGFCPVRRWLSSLSRRAAHGSRSSRISCEKFGRAKLAFHKLDIANPEVLPIGPPRSSPTTSAQPNYPFSEPTLSNEGTGTRPGVAWTGVTGSLALPRGPPSRHPRGVRRRRLYARRGQLPALPRDPPSGDRSASENLDGAYARCARATAALC